MMKWTASKLYWIFTTEHNFLPRLAEAIEIIFFCAASPCLSS